MSIQRSLLAGGPAFVTFNGASWALSDDSKLEMAPATSVISGAWYGDIDESYTDLVVKGTGTPLTYTNLATLWPYLQPTIGQRLFGNADVPFQWLSNNGDLITVKAGAITRMPDLVLGVDKAAIGAFELSGVIANGADPDTASSYYTIQTGQNNVPPAVVESTIPRQKYTATWGPNAGFDPVQAQDAWTISHEIKLAPVKIQGRTVDMKILSYRAMAKCMPTEPTMAQIDAALGAQGQLKHGAFLSANPSKADLVIAGAQSVTVTVKNAVLKTAGFVFGGKPLRNGEVGWVSTLNISTGVATPALVLA
jgi:hypothetical protein